MIKKDLIQIYPVVSKVNIGSLPIKKVWAFYEFSELSKKIVKEHEEFTKKLIGDLEIEVEQGFIKNVKNPENVAKFLHTIKDYENTLLCETIELKMTKKEILSLVNNNEGFTPDHLSILVANIMKEEEDSQTI